MKTLPIQKFTLYSNLLTILTVVGVFSGLLLSLPVYAQTAPFLITPYYGQRNITSNFDHEFPNYGVDGSLVGYDGTRRGPPASVTNCTNGLNGSCYNGHDGFDFAISYEHLIAAAAGTVTQAGWQVANNLLQRRRDDQHRGQLQSGGQPASGIPRQHSRQLQWLGGRDGGSTGGSNCQQR